MTQVRPPAAIKKAAKAAGAHTVADTLAWAKAQADNPTSNWYRQCQNFVRQAEGAPGGAPTATAAWQQAQSKHPGDMNPPAGAAIYWNGGSGNAGHAALSAGNGMAYTTDMAGNGKVSLEPISAINKWLGSKHQYQGWTEDVNGTHIQGLQAAVEGAQTATATPTAATADGTVPSLNEGDLAARYGWDAAFLDTHPDIKALTEKVVSGQIKDQSSFNAELYNTTWWKANADQVKANQTLKATNPKQYERNRLQVEGTVRALAGTIGAKYDDAKLHEISMQAFNLGWTTDEINRNLAKAVDWEKQVGGTAPLGGQAAAIEDKIRQTGAQYGVNVSDHFVSQRVAGILGQSETDQNYVDYFKNVAKQTYSAYAKQIDAGYTVADIAEPFKQSMAQILEINPQSIGLTDGTLRKALTSIDDQGQPSQVPIWKFENSLRADPRWQQTNNARSTYSGLTASIGQMFGKM